MQEYTFTTKANTVSSKASIDLPELNNNPNAQFKIMQNHAPSSRASYNLNRFEAKAAYNAASGEWYIKNVNGNPLNPNTAYNIVISSGGAVGSNISSTSPTSPTGTIITNPTPKERR